MPERIEKATARLTGDMVESKWFDRFARFGYASKGIVFLLVGVLAGARAFGRAGEAEDTPGVLESLQALPFHGVLLVVLSLGLAGYTTWRFAQALLDVEGDGNGWLGLSKRAIYLGTGIFYGYLAVFAVGVLVGMQSEDNGVQDVTASVLGWPGGQILIGIAGLCVIGGGLNEAFFGLSGRFREEFTHRQMAGWEKVALAGAGWWGHVGRGAVYAFIGYLLIRAAITFDPDEAGGLGEAFEELGKQPYGWALLLVAAAAFAAYGVYCGIIAMHGELDNEAAVHGSLEGVGKKGSEREGR